MLIVIIIQSKQNKLESINNNAHQVLIIITQRFKKIQVTRTYNIMNKVMTVYSIIVYYIVFTH